MPSMATDKSPSKQLMTTNALILDSVEARWITLLTWSFRTRINAFDLFVIVGPAADA